jgi:sec-independent protein translocase protein TatA
MLNIGPQELLLILVVALVVVGPQRLPELSRSIGRGLREFRKVQDEVKDMVKIDLNPDPPAVKPQGPTGGPRPRPARAAGSSADAESPTPTPPIASPTPEVGPTSPTPDVSAGDETAAG